MLSKLLDLSLLEHKDIRRWKSPNYAGYETKTSDLQCIRPKSNSLLILLRVYDIYKQINKCKY